MCVCVHALYACSASFVSERRMYRWTVQDIGNGEDCATPDGKGEPTYDYVEVNPAAKCGDDRDGGGGGQEPVSLVMSPQSARAPWPVRQKVTLF